MIVRFFSHMYDDDSLSLDACPCPHFISQVRMQRKVDECTHSDVRQGFHERWISCGHSWVISAIIFPRARIPNPKSSSTSPPSQLQPTLSELVIIVRDQLMPRMLGCHIRPSDFQRDVSDAAVVSNPRPSIESFCPGPKTVAEYCGIQGSR